MYHATRPATPGYDRVEAFLGRTHWTYANYVEAGRREFDDRGFKDTGTNPWEPCQREHYAQCYADLSCPRFKRGVAAAMGEAA